MKLMYLLDCMRNGLCVAVSQVDSEELLFTGFAVDVPETLWDREVYLIEWSKSGIDIYLKEDNDNYDHNANNQ